VTPREATYLCVDRGLGTPPIFQGTTTDKQRFRGKHIRVNAGTASVKLTVERKRVDIPPGPQPVGYDFRVRRGKVSTKPLPLGQRPCA